MNKKAFTLIEVLIVVAILGIMASIVVPVVNASVQQSREATAKGNLRVLVNTALRYEIENDCVAPGYPDNDATKNPKEKTLREQLVDGGYLPKIPENPFNELSDIEVIKDDKDFPDEADNKTGWYYKPATKEFKLNYPGTDSAGKLYYDY